MFFDNLLDRIGSRGYSTEISSFEKENRIECIFLQKTSTIAGIYYRYGVFSSSTGDIIVGMNLVCCINLKMKMISVGIPSISNLPNNLSFDDAISF